MMMVDNSVLWY